MVGRILPQKDLFFKSPSLSSSPFVVLPFPSLFLSPSPCVCRLCLSLNIYMMSCKGAGLIPEVIGVLFDIHWTELPVVFHGPVLAPGPAATRYCISSLTHQDKLTAIARHLHSSCFANITFIGIIPATAISHLSYGGERYIESELL